MVCSVQCVLWYWQFSFSNKLYPAWKCDFVRSFVQWSCSGTWDDGGNCLLLATRGLWLRYCKCMEYVTMLHSCRLTDGWHSGRALGRPADRVMWHLWMAWYKRSDMWPCCKLMQEQTCLLWCDAKKCHHGGFISGRQLGLTHCSECCIEKCLITSLWWGAVIGFINFHISCCVKSNLDCKSRKTWICRSDIVMNSAVPEGPINQMGS